MTDWKENGVRVIPGDQLASGVDGDLELARRGPGDRERHLAEVGDDS